MAELYQDTQARAYQTIPVWATHFSPLTVGPVNSSGLQVLADDLTAAATIRDNLAQEVDGARQARDFSFDVIHLIDINLPKLILSSIEDEAGLADDIAKLYTIIPQTPDLAIQRGRKLVPIWKAANAWQAAQSPVRPPLLRGTMTVALFETRMNGMPGLEAVLADWDSKLGTQRGKLRRDAMRVDRINKKAYLGMSGLADPDTDGLTALGTIDTTTDSELPDTLGIRQIAQGGTQGKQILVTYEPATLEPGETRVIQWLIEGVDATWQEAPWDASGNALGPFVVSQVVRVRTKVTNEHGNRTSGPRQLTIIEPAA